jgi:hypothetical protein
VLPRRRRAPAVRSAALPPRLSPTLGEPLRSSTKLLLLLAMVAGLLVLSFGTAMALPPSSGYGPTIEGYARYDVVAGECSPNEQPGVVAFRSLLQQKYGANGAGITRACNSSTRSAHQSGRAYDWMLDARRSADMAKANEVLGWLLATDEHGNKHAMARRLGIMYIIWNHQMWSAWNADAGWQPYNGWSPHTDHIHFSFGWPGARAETSYFVGPTSKTGFRDVPVGAHYEDAVLWLVEQGITSGRSPGLYEPGGTVNRGQMATFLYNLMERPHTDHRASYDDVRAEDYFANAVDWLDANSIATGRSAGRYAPWEDVSRGQMASFLWRLAGRPEPTQGHSFPDVGEDDHFHVAAAWLAEHRIATGMQDGTFGGGTRITRAQMALFIHRLASTPAAWSSAPAVPSSVG